MAWVDDVVALFTGPKFEVRNEEGSLWAEAVGGHLARPGADLLRLYRALGAPQRKVLLGAFFPTLRPELDRAMYLAVIREEAAAAPLSQALTALLFGPVDDEVLAATAGNPAAAKLALETWTWKNDAALRALATAALVVPKAAKLAKGALAYLEARAGHPSFPSLNEWNELRRLGATLDLETPRVIPRFTLVDGVARAEPAPDTWWLRVRSLSGPHVFWIKSKKDATTLTFARDPSRDVEVEAHQGQWHLRLAHLADDADGWAYFADVDKDGVYRRRGVDVQVMAGPFLSWVRAPR